MKKIVKIVYIIVSILFLFYIGLPNQQFPEKLDDSIQSEEPADTESLYRRAYFTNYSREEVLDHYVNEYLNDQKYYIKMPTYRLNYPPEEAQTIIRDQTRSTFLEEIVHPFRGSLFINGFEPKNDKDAIFIKGKPWKQKIIVRQVGSNVYIRLLLGLATIILVPMIYIKLKLSLKEFTEGLAKIWIYR